MAIDFQELFLFLLISKKKKKLMTLSLKKEKYCKKNLTLTLFVTTLELRDIGLFVSTCCCLIRLSITDLGAGTIGLALLIHT